jgi:hypothetical protein
MKGDLNMGEEKKDSLQSVADAVADTVSDYGNAVYGYAYLKAQLDTLKRYVCQNIYIERDMILKLMGWNGDGEH